MKDELLKSMALALTSDGGQYVGCLRRDVELSVRIRADCWTGERNVSPEFAGHRYDMLVVFTGQ